MYASITLIDYFLPETIITNDYLSQEFSDTNIKNIGEKVGVYERHVARDETALDLAFKASKKLFKHYNKNDIDFILYCTQSPDYYLPSGSCILQDKLKLRTNIGALDFNLGCSGYIYGLSLAKSLITSNTASTILLITSDTYSKYIYKRDLGNRIIFGDGATATIIEKSDYDGILNFSLGTDGSGFKNLIVKNGGLKHRYQPNSKEITYGSNNYRTDNHLYMNGPEIFNFTLQVVPKTVRNVLINNNIKMEDIDYTIFHQANKYLIEYLRKKIGIPQNKFFLDLYNTGNTVSSSIPIALKNAINKQIVKKGNKILLV